MPLVEPALGEVQRRMSALRQRVAAVRWARPETLHITVHFFGEIDESQLTAATAAVAPVADATRVFPVTLDILGSFPTRGAPRVLWLGSTHASPELPALAGACKKVLVATGFAVESRPFRAHCTLGRPRMPWPAEASRAWAAVATGPLTPMRFDASRLILYESTSAPGGSIHTPRAELAFGGG